MVLGVGHLLQLVRREQLVVGLSQRELTNPEGAGFDLRLGQIHEIIGSGYLGIVERKTPELKTLMSYPVDEGKPYVLKPGEIVATTTIESVNMPDNLTAHIKPRSTLYRSGLIYQSGNTPPGYRGTLTFNLLNPRNEPFVIEIGARFVFIEFLEVNGATALYRGQWQDGRTDAPESEKQV